MLMSVLTNLVRMVPLARTGPPALLVNVLMDTTMILAHQVNITERGYVTQHAVFEYFNIYYYDTNVKIFFNIFKKL